MGIQTSGTCKAETDKPEESEVPQHITPSGLLDRDPIGMAWIIALRTPIQGSSVTQSLPKFTENISKNGKKFLSLLKGKSRL
jgi:hypothetical protein